MAEVISTLASNALSKLSSLAFQKMASAWHLESQFDRLTATMTTIKEVLDAHDGSQLPGRKNLIERLQDAIYDADDLIDKFTTTVGRKRIMASSPYGRFIMKFRRFFSRDNQIATAFAISGEIEKIRKTLDDIVGDRANFCTMFPSREPAEPSGDVVKGRESCSSVVIEEVIGREEDKKKIRDDLLRYDQRDDSSTPHVKVLTIVGTGGHGKTTLAQLVYNDDDVKSHFELMEWVYVGDKLDVKGIIRRLVTSAAAEDLSLEHIQNQFRKKMGGKKYLLVLDDVWEESPGELLKLKSLLSVGEKGSRVLITTRNMHTACSIGTIPPFDLKVLSNDEAWKLFASVVFGAGGHEEQQKDPCWVQIGQEIANKCGNSPFAIKVIASHLRGKDEKECRYFKDHDLATIDNAAGNGIMPLLKLSYSRLSPQLKQCFVYCSLFPKDCEIDRIKICHLWMAQGFITSSSQHPGVSPEDVANQYFMELLDRCFFKDIQQDCLGIKSVKMQDLMHELAQDVAGEAIINADRGDHRISSATRRARHLSIPHVSSTPNFPSTFLEGENQLRTFLQFGTPIFESPPLKVSDFISKFQCIRVLDLHCMKIEQLPHLIGRLIHLRYLDLSGNHFKRLPTSFTNLYNLETLNLEGCSELKELPRNFSKLVNLQNLNTKSCSNLTCMPSRMGRLTRLRRLTTFVVSFGKSDCTTCSPKPHTVEASGFDELMLLENLRGSLDIVVIDGQGSSNGMSAVKTMASCLFNKSHLTALQIHMRKERNLSGEGSDDEELLEWLQPNSSIRSLCVSGNYRAQKLPSWMSMNNLASVLPNLVRIELLGCERCQHLPILSQLPSLESLVLCDLRDVEYVEINYGYDASTSTKFFPSLRILKLCNLPNVTGWWKPMGSESTELGGYDHEHQHRAQPLVPPSFHRLSELYIEDCPNMTSLPLCPSLKRLELSRFNKKLNVINVMETTTSMLKYLTIDNTDYLNHLPKSCLHSLTQMHIIKEGQESGFLSGSFLLHLTALETLKIWECNAHFQEEDEKETDEMPWRSLRRLRCLDFYELPNLTALPEWIECLTDLQELSIRSCGNLEELPGWISQLSSLRSLIIMNCSAMRVLPQGIRDLTSLRFLSLEGSSGLGERCKKPKGEDWPKIRHIPKIKLPDGQIVEQR